MKALLLMSVAAACLLPLRSVAGTISQSVTIFQQDGDGAPYNIVANPFNPALGTLEGIHATLIGSVTPALFGPSAPFPTMLELDASYLISFFSPANTYSGTIGPESLVPPAFGNGQQTVFGTPLAIDLHFYPDPSSLFILSPANPDGSPLAEFSFGADPINFGSGPGASDHTTFQGEFTLTYVYTPEPASLASFGIGLLSLVVLRGFRRSNPEITSA